MKHLFSRMTGIGLMFALLATGHAEGIKLATLPPLEPVPTQAVEVPSLPIQTKEETAAGNEPAGIGQYRQRFTIKTSSHRVNNDITIPVDGECAADGDLNTAWNTLRKSSGEWIEMSAADGRHYTVSGFRIANGYWKSDKVFSNNSRPRDVAISCDGVFVAKYTLEDSAELQTFMFSKPRVCSTFSLVIQDSYGGSTYGDCCITEIDLVGPGGNTLSSDGLDEWGRAVQALKRQLSGGQRLTMGDTGFAVMGLKLLLSEGFGVYNGPVDGSFDAQTGKALLRLAEKMTEAGFSAVYSDAIDENYWNSMLKYMDWLNKGG